MARQREVARAISREPSRAALLDIAENHREVIHPDRRQPLRPHQQAQSRPPVRQLRSLLRRWSAERLFLLRRCRGTAARAEPVDRDRSAGAGPGTRKSGARPLSKDEMSKGAVF
jgi:hypothetical protein